MYDQRDDRSVDGEWPSAQGAANGCNDLALLRRWAQGLDEGAFEQIVRRHSGWIWAQCMRGLHQRDLAEEAVQAVFLVLSRRAREIESGTRLSGWLFNAAQFVISDMRRREGRRRRNETVAQKARQLRLTWAKRQSQSNLEAELDEALARLSEHDRSVLLLRFYEGMEIARVGQTLGITREGAKKRLSRALGRLRKLLERRNVSVLAVAALLAGSGKAQASDRTVTQVIGVTSGRTVATRACLALAEALLKKMAGRYLLGSLVSAQIAAILLVGVFLMTHEGGRPVLMPPVRMTVADGAVVKSAGAVEAGAFMLPPAEASNEAPYVRVVDDQRTDVKTIDGAPADHGDGDPAIKALEADGKAFAQRGAAGGIAGQRLGARQFWQGGAAIAGHSMRVAGQSPAVIGRGSMSDNRGDNNRAAARRGSSPGARDVGPDEFEKETADARDEPKRRPPRPGRGQETPPTSTEPPIVAQPDPPVTLPPVETTRPSLPERPLPNRVTSRSPKS